MGRKRPHHGNRRRGSGGQPARRHEELTGTLVVTRPGAARVETAEGTFELARGGQREAMNGDEVRVVVVGVGHGGRKAVVRSVVSRAQTSFLGRFETAGPLGVVVPLDARLGRDFFVVPEDPSTSRLGVVPGDVVSARIVEYPTRKTAAVVTLERRLGSAGDLDLNIEAVVASHGLPGPFPPSALAQAEEIRAGVEEALSSDPLRRDLRDRFLVTVDPADARDFDDAVGAYRTPGGGYELLVSIADVAHYVSAGSPIDEEARRRTCSAYLVDRVIPMLPERLSCDVCSLRPGEDRLAMSVLIRLDAHGEVLGWDAAPSVIRSSARLDYDIVDRLLEGELEPRDLGCDEGASAEVAQSLRLLDEVRELRERVRSRRGAIDFESVEPKVELDDHGVPVGVRVRRRTRATGLVEEAMLVANECVARTLADAAAPAAFRVHEPPAPDDLRAAVRPLVELGAVDARAASEIIAGDPHAMRRALEGVRGRDESFVVNALLLRAQSRAVYLPANTGHYALGARAYCHFTSPIRRYPDLLVHRALKALLAGRLEGGAMRGQAAALPQLCRTCSERERAADAAARDSQKVKMAQYYAGRLGERAWGTVSRCESYGVFVLLDETCAEGLLPVRALGPEWLAYDEAHMTLTGEETGAVWRLGQRVEVVVHEADVSRGRIDLRLPRPFV